MALSAPQQNGDQLNQADVENHTLLIYPTEFIPHLPTVHTKPGEQSPAIRCNVVDFSDPSGVPLKYTGVLWFGVITNALKRQLGDNPILARMGKGQASPGKNAPWQLIDIMGEQAWVDYANQWLDSPEGQEWEAAGITELNRAAAAAQVAAAASPVQAAPAQAPVNTPPAAPRTAPPTAPPAPAVPAGPPSVAAPPTAPVAASNGAALPPGLEALIAALPAEQQDAARAVMRAQSGAAS